MKTMLRAGLAVVAMSVMAVFLGIVWVFLAYSAYAESASSYGF